MDLSPYPEPPVPFPLADMGKIVRVLERHGRKSSERRQDPQPWPAPEQYGQVRVPNTSPWCSTKTYHDEDSAVAVSSASPQRAVIAKISPARDSYSSAASSAVARVREGDTGSACLVGIQRDDITSLSSTDRSQFVGERESREELKPRAHLSLERISSFGRTDADTRNATKLLFRRAAERKTINDMANGMRGIQPMSYYPSDVALEPTPTPPSVSLLNYKSERVARATRSPRNQQSPKVVDSPPFAAQHTLYGSEAVVAKTPEMRRGEEPFLCASDGIVSREIEDLQVRELGILHSASRSGPTAAGIPRPYATTDIAWDFQQQDILP